MASPYDPNIPAAPEEDPRGSLVRIKLGGHLYDAVYQRNCHTCTHPVRALIEEKVLLNYSYPAIAAMYSDREVMGGNGEAIRLPAISPNSIQRHYESRHMPLELEAKRRIVDQRAQAMGESMEAAVDRVVEARDVVQMVLERGHDLLAKNAIEIDAKDTLSAAKLLAEMDERAGAQAADADAWSQAMSVYFETARRLMPPAMWAEFARELQRNPVLRALEAAQDDTVDAEFTEG